MLLQFARAPVPGQVKTRMMPHLSAAQACDLHCELAEWTCVQLLASDVGPVHISVAGQTGHPLFTRCRELGAMCVSQQCGQDLGQRMYNALRDGLSRYTRVVLVGSDCPGIDPVYIRQALAALDDVPVVLGPALDGGYVLIAVTAIEEQVFAGIPWGSDEVFERTVAALDEVGLGWRALAPLADIDVPQDLPVWADCRRASV